MSFGGDVFIFVEDKDLKVFILENGNINLLREIMNVFDGIKKKCDFILGCLFFIDEKSYVNVSFE